MGNSRGPTAYFFNKTNTEEETNKQTKKWKGNLQPKKDIRDVSTNSDMQIWFDSG